ncbi:MAG: metallophosphoesterase, partial [Clostridia bacterium]|nr:metallophosphoesterase [Clostridia bacterium]
GFKFLVVSDEHFLENMSYDKAVVNTTDKAFETLPDASMILALGDNVDLPWYEKAYTNYFNREFTKSVPLVSVPGPTHDMLVSPNEATLFGYHFNMPNQSKTSGYIKDVCGNYWYTYGDVLFIGLTNNWLNESSVKTNAEFVKSAVEANQDAKWKILISHLPFGTSGGGDPTDSFLTTYGDFVEENGIDVAMFGHLHYYYRTHQLKDGQVVKETPENNVITNPTAPASGITTTNAIAAASTASTANVTIFARYAPSFFFITAYSQNSFSYIRLSTLRFFCIFYQFSIPYLHDNFNIFIYFLLNVM